MIRFIEFNVNDFPSDYKKYMRKEEQMTKKFLRPGDNIIDIGCGIGRLIPQIAPRVKSYVGIDISPSYIKEAKKIASKYKNAKVMLLDVTKLSKKFSPDTFSKATCTWNTIGCMKASKKAITEAAKVTGGDMLFSVNAKGGLKTRTKAYELLGMKYRVNKKTETIYSDEWSFVKAYNKKEIRDLCKGTGFVIKKITPGFGIGHIVLLEKK